MKPTIDDKYIRVGQKFRGDVDGTIIKIVAIKGSSLLKNQQYVYIQYRKDKPIYYTTKDWFKCLQFTPI